MNENNDFTLEVNKSFDVIKKEIINTRNKVYSVVNTEMVLLYWNIGKHIMEIQHGDERAPYANYILIELSKRLTSEFGKGFSKRNLERMRKIYKLFPIASSLMTQLSWTHYIEIIKIHEEGKRNFYIKECVASNWSVRELQRQCCCNSYYL